MIDGKGLNEAGFESREEFLRQVVEAAGGAENEAAAELFDCSRELGFQFKKPGMEKASAFRIRLPAPDILIEVAASVRGWPA